MAVEKKVLDITKRSEDGQRLLSTFHRKIAGQEDATIVLSNIVESWKAGFCDPSKPMGNALFLGPTGSGKTRIVEVLAEALFGDENAMLKVNCGEFQMDHDIAKLIGSPPGYIGHRETTPYLSQANLNKYHTEKWPISLLLFDEIEKSSDTLWTLLLGILDKATMRTGDNQQINFSSTIVVLTSNLGAKQMEKAVEGGMGFLTPSKSAEKTHEELSSIATDSMKRKFTPEFVNRLNNIVVFHTLTEGQIRDILDIELERLRHRLIHSSKVFFTFAVTASAKRTLLKEGYSKVYGARHLKRAIETRISTPLSHLVASGQIADGDGININEVGSKDLEFALQPDMNVLLRLH